MPARSGRDLALGWQVMVGSAFVAHRGYRHDHVSHGNVRLQHTRAAAGHEPAAAQGDHFLQYPGGQRRADARMDHGQPLSVHRQLVQRLWAHLAAYGGDHAGLAALDQLLDHLTEEAEHTARRRVDGLDHPPRFDHRFRCRIVFEDRVELPAQAVAISDIQSPSARRLVTARLRSARPARTLSSCSWMMPASTMWPPGAR